ncbi:hypothetical protein SDC9_90085 [bioreactor metagenome]|uniref:Uncharacterized protein n=1 Tax=bioreactor metagenome TaxID=1076179 RepID=A0A644ZRD8_9ZZZZ
MQQFFICQRWVRTQRHQKIYCGGAAFEPCHNSTEEERQGHGAGGVWNDDKHPFALHRQRSQADFYFFDHLFFS